MKLEKVEKLVAKWYDKTEYFIQIINLKQALNHVLVSKKVHKLIRFNQTYIDIKLIHKNKQKMILKKIYVDQ